MLKHRIVSGSLIGAGLILAAYIMPTAGAWAALVLVAALGQLEFYAMMRRAEIPVFRVLGLLIGALLVTVTFLLAGPRPEQMAASYRWQNVILALGLMAVFIRQFPQKHNDRPLATIACTLLGVWYVPYLFNFITRLLYEWEPVRTPVGVSATGRLLLLYLVVVVKLTDVGAFFTGMAFGRHKLFPRISPAKTWEGLFGGMAVALLASVIFIRWNHGSLGHVSLGMRDAIALGLLLSVTGVVGDMFESLLKRAAGAKDSGRAIPGLGGFLDVLDSLLFGAPVFYVYLQLIKP